MEWTSSKPSSGPKPREASCFTVTETAVYIFGGAIHIKNLPVPVESNELWKFDFETETFTELNADIFSDMKPCPRANASLTSRNGKLYLFGGITEKQGWLGDLWCYDVENASWEESEINDCISPPIRCMHTLTSINYKDQTTLLLFGGFGPDVQDVSEEDWEDVEENDEIGQLQKEQESFKLTRFNDCYMFNTKTKVWQPLHFDIAPAKRAAHRIVYLESAQKCILFGGKGDTSRLGDLWEFDLATLTWKQLPSVSEIVPRSFHEMCLSSCGRNVMVHGGRDSFNGHLSDCYKLRFGEGENSVSSRKIDCDVAVGNHMFVANKNDKVYIFGGSSEFDAEYGECKNFHDELWVGKSTAKKAKMEE